MSVLPGPKLDRIVFLEQRIAPWTASAAEIGIEEEDVTALNALVVAARAGHTQALAARNASKQATQDFNSEVASMTTSASEIIQKIRLFAESTNNPEVYNLAQIPAPASPSPAGPPPQPTDVRHECNPDGSITLKWKGTLSHGAFFKVYRKLSGGGGQSGFQSIGAVAAKSLIDDTVPAGTHQAVYYVVGQRQTTTGQASEWYTVNFGVQGESSGGGTLALAA